MPIRSRIRNPVLILVFHPFDRDAKNPEDELNAWAFWHQRQPTNKQRIIDAETNNISEECGIARIEDLAYNAITVHWSPLQKPAFISLAIQCLSTDFSLQKGVKGLPMHLQVDTYTKVDNEYEMVHREGAAPHNVLPLFIFSSLVVFIRFA